jgi:hypothetical protein
MRKRPTVLAKARIEQRLAALDEKVAALLRECYTLDQVIEKMQMPRRTFFTLKKAGLLPWVEEIRPRAGRRIRYRKDLLDRYIAGQFRGPRAIGKAS